MSGVYTKNSLAHDLGFVGQRIELSYDEFEELFDGMESCRQWANGLGCSVEDKPSKQRVVFLNIVSET